MAAFIQCYTQGVCAPSISLTLEQEWRKGVVTRLADGLLYLYIDKKMAEKMALAITQNHGSGRYDAAKDPETLKHLLLEDLKAVCPDKHLGLLFTKEPSPAYDPLRSLREFEEHELTHEQKEYLKVLEGERPDFSTMVHAHILPGTEIGYFKIDLFDSYDFPETSAIIDGAMKEIVDARALIIDLRENCGGDPATVALVASYLFDEKQIINQLYKRCIDTTFSFYVEPEKLTRVFGGKKPIYVLISEKTFSGGEELAYDLKWSKRAILIGQTTGGGAHPVRPLVIDDYICATIPFEKAINPHTGTNWEGVGVRPDHTIPLDGDGLALAVRLLGSLFNDE